MQQTADSTADGQAGWLQKAGGADGKKPKKKRYFTVGDFGLAYYDKELSDAKGGAAGESAAKHIKGVRHRHAFVRSHTRKQGNRKPG